MDEDVILKLSGKQADKINAPCIQITGTNGEDLIEVWLIPNFWPHRWD
ncbi:20702_t:CDS:2, partial [Entrophospora sp. SA101]